MKICICGGGNIAHSLAAVLSVSNDVSVLTRHPENWSSHLRCEQGLKHEIRQRGRPICATSDRRVVTDSECVIVALPRFAIKSVVDEIVGGVHHGQAVVFIPAPSGMDGIVERFSAMGVVTIGFQRVPFVARIIEYGKSIWISAVREVHRLAFSDMSDADKWKHFFERNFGGTVEYLSSFLSFTFSNSNPLLHPARLGVLLRGGDYAQCPYFYAEWTDESSDMYVAADEEMHRVFEAYSSQAAKSDYESALAHYEVTCPKELTHKIRGIESLQAILAPWKKFADGMWRPDYESRYFTEDIPFGTKVIQDYARKIKVETPVIDSMIATVGDYCPDLISINERRG